MKRISANAWMTVVLAGALGGHARVAWADETAAGRPVRMGATTVTVIDEHETVDDVITRIRAERGRGDGKVGAKDKAKDKPTGGAGSTTTTPGKTGAHPDVHGAPGAQSGTSNGAGTTSGDATTDSATDRAEDRREAALRRQALIEERRERRAAARERDEDREAAARGALRRLSR